MIEERRAEGRKKQSQKSGSRRFKNNPRPVPRLSVSGEGVAARPGEALADGSCESNHIPRAGKEAAK
ncbi:hypothetical protein A6X21_18275 [Planctopirus hydrillae]|uniref:Uncharacterized protein n=1 Tax=Planctopirus hydrillae TaxID=1841610 RepID=A0A1C3EKC2_9PLAN|nr:hypothetical protein A6X21_18275 [Planctopirus hydrillae]